MNGRRRKLPCTGGGNSISCKFGQEAVSSFREVCTKIPYYMQLRETQPALLLQATSGSLTVLHFSMDRPTFTHFLSSFTCHLAMPCHPISIFGEARALPSNVHRNQKISFAWLIGHWIPFRFDLWNTALLLMSSRSEVVPDLPRSRNRLGIVRENAGRRKERLRNTR